MFLRRLRGLLGPRSGKGAPSSAGARLYFPPTQTDPFGGVEDVFTTKRGHKLAVHRGYRYGVKQAWTNFADLYALGHLSDLGLLDAGEESFLRQAIGHRAVTLPLAEIRAWAQPVLARHADHFIPGTLDEGFAPAIKMSPSQFSQALIERQSGLGHLFASLTRRGLLAMPLEDRRVLEIGFSSGLTTFALAGLGLKATGIDNSYDGALAGYRPMEAAFYQDYVERHPDFAYADITKTTPFEAQSFDWIQSSSVIEHIADLEAAFREMHRLLKPGGLIIHDYNPYFSLNGGHAFGVLDAPWGHARLDAEEMGLYLKRFRPHEAEPALEWLSTSLPRSHAIGHVQACILKAGFDLCLWEESVQERHLALATREIFEECLSVNPQITLADLTASMIRFVARRPE